MPPEFTSALARETARDFIQAHAPASGGLAARLAEAIEIALLTAVRHERAECVALCHARHQLWERTAARPETPAPLRQEAEQRSNEAVYLADALATR
jgi:hypothetical protein